MTSERECVEPDAVLMPAGAGPFRCETIPGTPLWAPMVRRTRPTVSIDGQQLDAVNVSGWLPTTPELDADAEPWRRLITDAELAFALGLAAG